jgi:hypothetical protein
MPLRAQEPQQPPADQPKNEEQTFNLLRDTEQTAREEEEEQVEVFQPRIEPGTIECNFTLGFLNLNQVVLSADQIIYKYDEEATYWGDIAIKGESAFNPIFHLGYVLTPFFSLEGTFGVSFSTYTTDITRRVRRANEAGSTPDPEEPALGEFDAEQRSLVTLNAGLNGVFYPFNLGGGEGRFHPYLTGGFGRMWYDMNSNYIDSAATAWDFNFGGGIRLIGDDLISLRIEAVLHVHDLEFTPAANFEERDEGTLIIPLTTFPDEDIVTQYESQSISSLAWGIGFFASF